MRMKTLQDDGGIIHGKEEEYDYIYGFGSIMNTSTHASWLGENMEPLKGTKVWLLPSFGYKRSWNFRSSTGFTALGVVKVKGDEEEIVEKVNGVLFRVPKSMMGGFDKREVGYDRVEIPKDQIVMATAAECNPSDGETSVTTTTITLEEHLGETKEKIWIYVPQNVQEADMNHPLLQSYVDTVLHGCLEWGGREMAEEFVLSTDGWSFYFLNDTPNSRRPWLFRKQYDIIDGILRTHGAKTHFAERKHPEQFTSAFLIQFMKGTWSLPRRNPSFTGRDSQLHQIHAKLRSSTVQTPSKLRIAGMAGVGKTQLCCEYCYRYYPSFYGLVIWLHAENAETLAAGYQQLLADTTGKDAVARDVKDTEEMLMEVKSRLFRSKVPWLLVFDNLEDHSLLQKFVPHGGMPGCHVLFTTRCLQENNDCIDYSKMTDDRHYHDEATLILKCFSPHESLDLLCRSAGSHNIEGKANEEAAHSLAEHLGHLPLALGMAAAYMHRCDVLCTEYLTRYMSNDSEITQKCFLLGDGGSIVASSLLLSLEAIQKENPLALETLHLLAWLGPDQITKALIRSLLGAKRQQQQQLDDERKKKNECDMNNKNNKNKNPSLSHHYIKLLARPKVASTLMSIGFGLVPVSFFFNPKLFQGDARKLMTLMGICTILSTTVSAIIVFDYTQNQANGNDNVKSPVEKFKTISSVPSSLSTVASYSMLTTFSGDLFEQTDTIWKICKSFSILLVKDGKGSMHRLLAQVLQCTQTQHRKNNDILNLEICVSSLVHLWNFKPKETDTWQSSALLLEHVKSVIHHIIRNLPSKCSSFDSTLSFQNRYQLLLNTAKLSKEAGIFSAMALNRFKESQIYLEQSLEILSYIDCEEITSYVDQRRAECFHELGRVFRYQGNWEKSEKSLLNALKLRNKNVATDEADCTTESKFNVADTLHEIGVLEVQKHNLAPAESFLLQSLELLRSLECTAEPLRIHDMAHSITCEDIQAACASTLHQLAAVQVARKPPSLDEAEKLLKEALNLTSQIGSRAATIKQLARVTLRQGILDKAEDYLAQALDLYVELYGEKSTQHINVAAVKFQQGALASQRGDLERAWLDFSECLRIRRHVYAYACISDNTTKKHSGSSSKQTRNEVYPAHFDISSVLHELGCVAFAQQQTTKANEILKAEKEILERLQQEAGSLSSQSNRLFQAQLRNLTWLRKSAKKVGDDALVQKYIVERSDLKQKMVSSVCRVSEENLDLEPNHQIKIKSILQDEALRCRFAARQYALHLIRKQSTRNVLSEAKRKKKLKSELLESLSLLQREIEMSFGDVLEVPAIHFQQKVSDALEDASFSSCSLLLEACDEFRDVLREQGIKVQDKFVPDPS